MNNTHHLQAPGGWPGISEPSTDGRLWPTLIFPKRTPCLFQARSWCLSTWVPCRQQMNLGRRSRRYDRCVWAKYSPRHDAGFRTLPVPWGQFCFIVFKSWPFEFFYRKVSDHLFMHFFPETPNDWCQTIDKPYRWEVAVFILVFHGKKAGDVRGVAKDGCFWALKTDFCLQNAFNGALGILVSLDQGPLVSFSDTPPATTMYALIYSIYIFLCITVSWLIVYLVLVCK